ncbi:MAG: hypothetical protein QM734_12385 [Cyclobacteriaceae bacterium]
MKRITLYFFLLITFSSWSQIHESFEDNHRGWSTTTDANSSRKIENGKYVLETLEKEHGKFIEMPGYFDPNKDFTLEISFTERSGADNNGFGLFWGKATSSTYNEFIITTNGYYMIAPKGKGEWVETKLVKPMGETNVLRVEKKGETVSCYLNGTRVYKDYLPNYGFEVGFLNYINMVLEVDYFNFDQANNEVRIVENLPRGLTRENMGSAINTEADEVGPIISADGRTLYFGREDYQYNLGGVDDGEDVWYSVNDGAQWRTAINIGSPVNDTQVTNLASVSADNNTLVFAKSGKFMYRKRTESGWSELIDFGIYYTNESAHQEAQLAVDGKAMLFTIKNSDNLYYNKDVDEKDIYVSIQDRDGNWSPPLNLGPKINTMGDETGPFLSSDGRTLYFASNGRPGFGGTDLYMTKRIGDGWTNWSEPLNLGSEINTSGFDAYYTLPASGDYAYLVGDINSFESR